MAGQQLGNLGGAAVNRLLVSVIIPCYNAERWVAEAIESALAQTYRPIEVVVIDDGSTDGSLGIIRRYRDRVKWESGPNRGGDAARNRGFQLSAGQLIQWLDADDYLLSEKIEREVRHLEESGADVVFGDWRHEYVDAHGGRRLGPVVSAKTDDVLFGLLSGWWAASDAYLMRRWVVEVINGWDENLPAAQDLDLWIRACIVGARFTYQSGCYSVYRRHGSTTVSTRDRTGRLVMYGRVMEKAHELLESSGLLTSRYRQAMALSHFHVARNLYEADRDAYRRHVRMALELDPGFTPRESRLFNAAARVAGLAAAERAAVAKRRGVRAIRGLAGVLGHRRFPRPSSSVPATNVGERHRATEW